MKHIKSFEERSVIYEKDKDDNFVKCNWCDWYGKENELTTDDDDNSEVCCPNCKSDEHLMDLYPFDDDFFQYEKKINLYQT